MVYVPPNGDTKGVVGAEKVLKRDEASLAESSRAGTIYPVFGSVDRLVLGLLKPVFEPMGVVVTDQIVKDVSLPLLTVRSTRGTGANGNVPADSRFVRSSRVRVSAIFDGLNADSRCAELLEAVQQVLFMSWHDHVVVRGVGYISAFDNFTEPTRVTDFQTATNIVQYASLPRGYVRYEQVFNIIFRPDSSVHNEFVKRIS